MTLDVSIGKISIQDYDPDNDTTVCYLDIDQCPNLDYDLCPVDYTLWPREAYRSGSTGFWAFFRDHVKEIYFKLRDNPNSNERDVARIKPLIEQIRSLPDDCGDPFDDDRMKWFKFWCNRAVELYGDDAGIYFG